jgi:hypothetical protein
VIIEFKTAYIHYHVNKIFGTNYVNTEQASGRTIMRHNTIGSAELEMIVRNNFTIVPSYSEALLMNVDTTQSGQVHDANANVTSPIFGPTRSITWNTLANSASSSGYITGFFSSAAIPNIIHSSTLPNIENVDILSPVSSDRTFRTSLRNMLRSPWSRRRHKNEIQQCSRRSNTMFMLSSPESLDGYSVELDQRLQSVHLTRNYSSCSDVNEDRLKKDSFSNYDCIPGTITIDNNCTNMTNSVVSKVIQTNVKTKEISNNGSVNGIRPKPPRPCSFNMHGNEFATCSSTTPSETNRAYVKSNLPKVPISNILTENSTYDIVAPTPSSPPPYEQALKMQKHNPQEAEGTQSGSQALSNENRSQYNVIMETSL